MASFWPSRLFSKVEFADVRPSMMRLPRAGLSLAWRAIVVSDSLRRAEVTDCVLRRADPGRGRAVERAGSTLLLSVVALLCTAIASLRSHTGARTCFLRGAPGPARGVLGRRGVSGQAAGRPMMLRGSACAERAGPGPACSCAHLWAYATRSFQRQRFSCSATPVQRRAGPVPDGRPFPPPPRAEPVSGKTPARPFRGRSPRPTRRAEQPAVQPPSTARDHPHHHPATHPPARSPA